MGITGFIICAIDSAAVNLALILLLISIGLIGLHSLLLLMHHYLHLFCLLFITNDNGLSSGFNEIRSPNDKLFSKFKFNYTCSSICSRLNKFIRYYLCPNSNCFILFTLAFSLSLYHLCCC